MKKNIILNGKRISEEELKKKKKDLEGKKGVSLCEVTKDNYVIRIQG